MTHKICK